LRLPIPDSELEDPYTAPYYHPGKDAPEIEYMLDRRRQLGGFLPERRSKYTPVSLPGDKAYERLAKGSGQQEVATTMALVQLFKVLLRDNEFGKLIVPIITDDAHPFRLDAILPSLNLFNTTGQNYMPLDLVLQLSYQQSDSAGLMHTGIT